MHAHTQHCRGKKIIQNDLFSSNTSIIIIKEFLEQSVVTLPITQNATLHQFLLKPQKK